MKPASHPLIFIVAAASLAACTTVPETIVQHPTTAHPQPMPVAPPANGAIFQAGAYRPMFEDYRARMVGDILTIAINEKTSAGKSALTSGSKDGSVNSSVSQLFGVPASTVAKLGVGASTANEFEEKGTQASSNTFSGTITATVIDVLPNGNLLVSGEKQIAFDKGIEFVRFSGVVNPRNIAAGNVVSSTQVADTRLEYRTNSRVDKAELMSQLARFFFSLAPL